LTNHNNNVIICYTTWGVEYYETRRGKCPVREFIDHLDIKAKAKIARTIDLLEQFGIDLEMPGKIFILLL
jgi:hypothetical protein